MATTAYLQHIVAWQHRRKAVGMASICSANRFVLQAAMLQAKADRTPLCIESTSNQVNQFGGYTGMTAADFATYVAGIATEMRFPMTKILLGGDHLGPNPWQKESADVAMPKALELIRSCVLAGYAKIHLDASMRCADDPAVLSEETITARAAEMCAAAEAAHRELPRGRPAPLYIIGTEVPIPGGEQSPETGLAATTPAAARTTIEQSRNAFVARGLEKAWQRVIGVVVQPSVEFSDSNVFAYNSKKARPLSRMILKHKNLVFEAHSTDYQTPQALRQLVEDHFAILKVGPWLTFALREALFALADMEQDWLPLHSGMVASNLRQVLDDVMLANPGYWKPYYHGDEAARKFARQFSFSDRCRYYWPQPQLEAAVTKLISNLTAHPVPLSLLSQYLPHQYEAVRQGVISNDPTAMIHHKIREVASYYWRACGA